MSASSFHMWWHNPDVRYRQMSVTLTVLEEPSVDDLYFWALQTDFCDEDEVVFSGAHTGLQWIDGYPNNNAVNWGGYISAEGQTEFGPGLPSELLGSTSSLPSAADNVNTRNYNWAEGVSYRFSVFSVAIFLPRNAHAFTPRRML